MNLSRLETVLGELTAAIRFLWRNPAFSALAIVTLSWQRAAATNSAGSARPGCGD